MFREFRASGWGIEGLRVQGLGFGFGIEGLRVEGLGFGFGL